MPFDFSNPGFLLIILAMGASAFVRWRFNRVMKKIGRIATRSGMSGREIAAAMLDHYGIHDVQITATRGSLTDHYNPLKKTVNLSQPVYDQRTVAAAAIAAHECGHAVQHNVGYSFLQFRSALVPIVNLGARFSTILLYGGLFLLFAAPALGRTVLLAGIIALGASALFAVVTLPVEFDASRRALAWLEDTGVTRGEEHEAAKEGLRWAAMTYVVAALAAVANLIYWLQYLNSRN